MIKQLDIKDLVDPDLDIDSALDAFDKSKWKEKVNKVQAQEDEPFLDPFPDCPLNRFR